MGMKGLPSDHGDGYEILMPRFIVVWCRDVGCSSSHEWLLNRFDVIT